MQPGSVRKAVLVAIAGAFAIGASACQAGPPDRDAPAVAVTTVADPTAAVPGGIPESAFAGQRPFTGPAAARYGQADLRAAYRETVDFAFGTGWSPALIRTNSEQLASAHFANARSYLTPAGRKALDATLGRVVQGDKAARKKLADAMFFAVAGPDGMTPVPTGSVVTDRRFTEASVAIDRSRGVERLSVSFAAKAQIQLWDAAGRRYAMPTSRVVRYLLVRNTGSNHRARPFLIDSWEIRMSASRPRQVG